MTNTYDEYGEIYLGGGIGAYVQYASKFNSGQKWFLSFAILLVICMAAYAAYLHRAVMKNKFVWMPRRGYSSDPKSDPGALGRDHSGIVSGRSFEKGTFA
jgi:hypothetical protein